VAFNINDFKHSIPDGLAREAHFEMQIALPSIVKGDARQMSLMCSAASLPSRSADVVKIRRGGQGLESPYVTGLSYTPLDVSFYCDVESNTIRTLQRWMDSYMDLRVGNMYAMQYKEYYNADLKLFQYDSKGKKIADYTFYGAFPASLGQVNFSWAAQNSLVIVPATFAYTYYKMDDSPPKSKDNLSSTLQPAQNNKLPATGSSLISAKTKPFVPGGGSFGGGGASGDF
jgi:uncharacterized membrane protein YgcG